MKKSSKFSFNEWWNKQGRLVDEPNEGRGGTSSVLYIAAEDGRPAVYIKRQEGYTYRTLLHPIKRPTIMRELYTSQALEKLGIKVPKIYYCDYQKNADNVVQALLISKSLARYISLDEWYEAQEEKSFSPGLIDETLKEIAATIATIHKAGWQHGCLYPKHIFIKQGRDAPKKPKIALIDLEKGSKRWFKKTASKKDLAQLFKCKSKMPQKDLDTFLKYYEGYFNKDKLFP